jgi:hypothetical protein
MAQVPGLQGESSEFKLPTQQNKQKEPLGM